MAWHHHAHHAIKHHAVGFVSRHPVLTTILAVVGISTIGSIAMGKHATPSPSQQNQTPPKAGA